MLYGAKEGCVPVGTTDMDYISFGKGHDILVMLPGLGDGFTTIKGMAFTFSILYRTYAQNYKVYVFSRKNQLKDGCSIREMAEDQAEAMIKLGIKKANVLGISQGGMLAQYLTIDYPDLVKKLVLAVTLSKPNENMQEIIRNWITLARQNKYKDILIDTAEKSYSEPYLKKYRFLYPLFGLMGKPKDFHRFLIQAESCLQHNAYAELNKITCPALIIGGGRDKIAGTVSSVEMAEKIKNSQLHIYETLGHGAYEEAKDFNTRVINFLAE